MPLYDVMGYGQADADPLELILPMKSAEYAKQL
jgi:hypothetical protein